MARKLMAKYECSRCTREWYVEFKKGEDPPEPAQFIMRLNAPGEPEFTVEYKELCTSCTSTVRNHACGIAKQLEKKSPDRAKKEASEDASVDENTKPKQPAAQTSRTSSVGSSAG